MSETAQVALDRMIPWLREKFSVTHAMAGKCELQLIEARELARHEASVGEKFSLLFRGPTDRPLDQRICTFEHPSAGRFDLFIVPVFSRDPDARHYEAIVNREAPPKSMTPVFPS